MLATLEAMPFRMTIDIRYATVARHHAQKQLEKPKVPYFRQQALRVTHLSQEVGCLCIDTT